MRFLRRLSGLVQVAVLLVTVCLAGQGWAADEQTWAIVASPSVRQRGIADLLTVQLTGIEGISLVERDEQMLPQSELEIAALYDTASTRQRLELGARVTSEVLVVLDVTTSLRVTLDPESKPNRPVTAKDGELEADLPVSEVEVLRVMVCHCPTGARVVRHSVDLAGKSAADIVTEVESVVARARTKLRDGVKYIVGVTPPINKGVQVYDATLATAIGELIESSLFAQQGVAVIELEEAQAILKELPNAPDIKQERAVPALLSAELTPAKGASANTALPAIQLVATFPNGKTTQQRVQAETAEDLAAALSAPIRTLLGGLPEGSPGATTDFQTAWLLEQAEMCSSLGEWKAAIDLRHAVLLLNPHEVAVRVGLIMDARLLLRQLASTPLQKTPWPGTPGSLDRAEAVLSIYQAQLDQQEYLIRNSKLDAKQALRLMYAQGYAQQQTGLQTREVEKNPEVARLLAQAETSRKQHLQSIAAAVFQLPMPPDADEPYQRRGVHGDLQDAILMQVTRRVDFQEPQTEDIEVLTRIWIDSVPDGLGLTSPFAAITYQLYPEASEIRTKSRYRKLSYKDRSISQDDWTSLLMSLCNVDHASMRLAARAELLKWRWYLLDANSTDEEVEFLLDLAKATSLELEAYPVKDNGGRSFFGGGGDPRSLVQGLEWMLYRYSVMPDPFAERREVVSSPAAPRPGSNDIANRPTPVLNLTPLSLLQSTRAANQPARPGAPPVKPFEGLVDLRMFRNLHWLACGDQLDLLWSDQALMCIPKRGVLQPFAVGNEPPSGISDVRFDGEYIWIATLGNKLLVYDLAGNLKYEVGASTGLPGSEHKMMVQPLGNKQAIVAGAFGNPLRSWCAKIDVNPENPETHVFHEARQVDRRGLGSGPIERKAADRAAVGFVPQFMVLAPGGEDAGAVDKEMVCLGVARAPNMACDSLLYIDLDSLKVTSAPIGHVLGPVHYNAVFDANQFVVVGDKLYHSSAMPNLLRDIGASPAPNMFMVGNSNSWPSFLPGLRELYLPYATNWYMIDAEKETAKSLLPAGGRQPMSIEPAQFFRSAHYGLVALGQSGRLYQVEMKDNEPVVHVASPPAGAAPPGTAQRPVPESIRVSDSTQRLATLSSDELSAIRNEITRLTSRGIELPDDAQRFYSSNYSSIEAQLPCLSVHGLYLDPPTERDGFRLDLVDGRLVQAFDLETSRPASNIYYDDAGFPILVVNYNSGYPSTHQKPLNWIWLTYNSRGIQERAVHFNGDLKFSSVTVYETKGNYLCRDQFRFDERGKLVRQSSSRPPLDAKGQPVSGDDPSEVAYSPLQQELLAPTRVGMKPCLPLPEPPVGN